MCNELSRRRRRAASARALEDKDTTSLDGGTPATIEVYSGLYVNEASDIAGKSDLSDDVFRERVSINNFFIICRYFYHFILFI